MPLITLEEAIGHLNLFDLATDGASPPTITDERLPTLEMKMAQAEAIIIDYLKHQETGWNDQTVPPQIKGAVLLMLSALWENREGTGETGDYLKPSGAIAMLLMRSRDPALA